jgi:hypothetical protein|tara:strand:+ start:875 stop:1573 length:699 start_codon:yes stop_codon:yes gene_type:complete
LLNLKIPTMKKIYLLLIISLSFTMGVYAQNIVRVYDFDVKMGHASDVARNFADYHDVERKSGGAILQSVSFVDGVTHRMIFAGDPENWGPKVKKSDAEWEAYLRKQQLHTNRAGGSMVMTSLMWRMEGDFDKCKTSRYWEIIPEEPKKYVKAREKFVKAIGDVLEWRIMGLSSIDMGGLGGTHTSLLCGSDLNDIIITGRKIQKTKAYEVYLEERGNVKLIKSYSANYIHNF